MASTPGHHNLVELIADVWEVVHVVGKIKGVTVVVNTGESALIPIIADAYPEGLARGDRLSIKGMLQTEKIGEKYLHYVRPLHLERLRTRRSTPWIIENFVP
jgi:hypothetical protein